MTRINLPEDIKTITVSGLQSNIGKTLLSQHLLSLLKNTAAIKITATDFETFITDKEDVIMIEEKKHLAFKKRRGIKGSMDKPN